jgi:hypothetical protein
MGKIAGGAAMKKHGKRISANSAKSLKKRRANAKEQYDGGKKYNVDCTVCNTTLDCKVALKSLF